MAYAGPEKELSTVDQQAASVKLPVATDDIILEELPSRARRKGGPGEFLLWSSHRGRVCSYNWLYV